MNIDELGDLVGTSVLLRTTISQRKYRANFIGYKKDKSIILTKPSSHCGGEENSLLAGEEVIVHFLSNAKACAFKAGVMHIASAPYPYIHLTYPRHIQFEQFRHYNRIKIKDASATLLIPENEPMEVSVIDMSMGGLQLECCSSCLDDGAHINIEFALPEELDIEPVVLPVTVQNHHHGQGGIELYGLKFDPLKPDKTARLQQLLGYFVSLPAEN
ncbi:flagellar brake protein [Psychrobium sp. 1_MG-2023]|uniref:flagellar brake protein n=1 Tax=Psychrobium sp. 1_MG-2023 TaxID=3062624 RepID=UPI000C34C23A|nr:flagellar brake protein [Psychrobium sp. 1_MG-2023]MDP2561812.1 flagellar brake protein [Psychrobium sp. 1_MG-2023]PKF55815.1 hypothetical protein CW748_11785 [Alteromonadales bacterium alter-6D02]